MPGIKDRLVNSLLLQNPVTRRLMSGTASVLGNTPAQTGLTLGRGLLDTTPAGDFMAMGEGIRNRDPLTFGLGAASLLVPGTIKPQMAENIVNKFRQTLDSSISKNAPAELTDELEFMMEGMEVPDKGLAFDELFDLIDEGEMPKKLLKPARKIGIDVGMFREVPEEELKRTVSMGGKSFDFAMDGKKYKFNDEFRSIRDALLENQP